MSEIILHHFDISPFAEKIRMALGIKGLPWRSVQIPLIMPKPQLTLLTGGYRKTPVMQIGADIFCDTNCIAQELERRYPRPTLFPNGSAGIAMALSFWSNRAFFDPGAGLSMGLNPDIPEPVLADRKAFFNFMDFDRLGDEILHLFSQLLAHLAILDEQLSNGTRFLLGDAPGWADINAYFVVWMARNNIPAMADRLDQFTYIGDWESRLNRIGHGNRSELDAEDAIHVAEVSDPPPGLGIDKDDPLKLAAGDEVIVAPDDYGKVPVAGSLITLNKTRITIRRRDNRIGVVNVHFPRPGYRVQPRD